MKVVLTEIVELRGSDVKAWDEKRFDMLKKMNPDGRLAVTDEKGQVFIAPIGKLEKLSE